MLPLAPDAPQPVASVLSDLPLHQWRVGERRYITDKDLMAKPEAHTKKDKDIKKPNVDDQLLEQYPFLQRHIKKPSEQAAKRARVGKAKQLRRLATLS